MATARALARSSGGSRRPTALPTVHDPRLAAALSSRPCLRPAANCQRPAAPPAVPGTPPAPGGRAYWPGARRGATWHAGRGGSPSLLAWSAPWRYHTAHVAHSYAL